MKTFECIARHGNTGKEIVIMVRAYTEQNAQREAVQLARQQFGPHGSISIISIRQL